MDRAAGGASEPLLVALEGSRATAIPRFGERSDFRRFPRLSGGEPVIAREPRSGKEGFDAAVAAAGAAEARQLTGGGPGKRIVPPFAADRVCAFNRPALHYDAAPDARAENRAEHDLRAFRRAVDRLRERETVGVVGKAHFAPEQALEVGLHRHPVQHAGVGVLEPSGFA